MKNKTIRQSNFELLRIISMLMIIIFHIAFHGQIIDKFPTNGISINKTWIFAIRALGKLGVNLFVLISGYFLINKNKIKISRIIKLWLQILFYCIGIYLLFVILGKEPFRIRKFLETFIPIASKRWWFATIYFVMYLFSPFINIFLTKLSKKNYKKILILTTIIWSIIPTFIYTPFGCSELLWFIYLYSVAAYIRLYKDDIKVNKLKCLLMFIGVFVLSLSMSLIISYLKTDHPSLNKYIFRLYDMQTLSQFIMAISIFLLFKNIDIKYNKIINVISSTTFGIYLMHDHAFIRFYIWRDFFRIKDYAHSSILILYTIGMTLLVFIVLGIVELIRIYLLEKNYMKIIDKADPKLEKIKNKFWENERINKLLD